MPDYGMKVSQPGHDVLTAAKERLIFSSAYDTFKVFVDGSGSRLVPAADFPGDRKTEIITIAHNLSYKPAFWVFTDHPLFYTAGQLSPYTTKSIGVAAYSGIDYAVDTTNLYIYLNNAAAVSVTIEYRYHIFYNQIAA